MTDKNKEIKNYLNYYIEMKNSPQYAIMLKGLWGSGKTWFIKNFIKELKNKEIKILYISLYGISETSQIDDEIFKQLHPLLSSKGTEIASRILKGFIKGTLKINLDNDPKSDARANIGIPDLNLPEYLRNTNGYILVFDDLERCSLSISEVLGYINYFVEHDGQKVIVICNEDVIASSFSDEKYITDRSYQKIKEKLIGKTFQVDPDFSEAIKIFINEIALESTKNLLIEHIEIIKKIYINANFKNLRHLRQAILDFARMVEILDMAARKKIELMEHLLSFFLIYSFELKSGAMLPSHIKLIGGSFPKKDSTPLGLIEPGNLYTYLSEKYTDVKIMDTLLNSTTWESIFNTGLFDSEEINRALINSRYFPAENRPDWIILWHMHDLLDNELEMAIKNVEKSFLEKNIPNLGELIHAVSNLMRLSKIGIYDKKRTEIVELGLANIQKMKNNGTLREIFSNHIKSRNKTSYESLGYHEIEEQDFADFLKKVDEIGFDSITENYPNEALEMLELLQTNTNQFVTELIHNNYKAAKYVGMPILSFIDHEKFVQVLSNLRPRQIYQVDHMFEERYSTEHYRRKLKDEKDWLLCIANKLDILCKKRERKMSGHVLKGLRDRILAGAKLFAENEVRLT